MANNSQSDTQSKHGNTRLPYGLCKKHGIKLPQGATPHDAWEALKKIGIDPKKEYQKLKQKQMDDYVANSKKAFAAKDSRIKAAINAFTTEWVPRDPKGKPTPNNKYTGMTRDELFEVKVPHVPQDWTGVIPWAATQDNLNWHAEFDKDNKKEVKSKSAYRSNVTYSQFTDKDAADLSSKYDDLYTDGDFLTARKFYIAAPAGKNGFSMSQNLNYKLNMGNTDLDENEQYIDDELQRGMHPLGKDIQLVRYAHHDFLDMLGVKNYQTMTEDQLKKALVGKEIKNKSYMSTSYDSSKSPFAPNAPLGGGRELVMKVNAQKDAKGVLGERTQSEVILNKGTNFRVKDVKYDGSYATPRIGGMLPRVVVELEAY